MEHIFRDQISCFFHANMHTYSLQETGNRFRRRNRGKSALAWKKVMKFATINLLNYTVYSCSYYTQSYGLHWGPQLFEIHAYEYFKFFSFWTCSIGHAHALALVACSLHSVYLILISICSPTHTSPPSTGDFCSDNSAYWKEGAMVFADYSGTNQRSNVL